MARKKKGRKEANKRVSEKISVLRHESVPEKQAVAEALSMERAGRLRRGGKYIHKRKSRRRSGR
jgi:hypothetical protein